MATTVRSSSSNHSTTGTAITVTAPTGTAAGDVVICLIHGNNQTTIVDNNGSTPFTADLSDYKPNTTDGHTVAVYSRRIQSGDPSSYAFTLGTSGRWSIVAICIQNPNPSTLYDIAPSSYHASNTDNPGNSSTTVTTPFIITNTANALHFPILFVDSSSGTISSSPAGYTSVQNTTDQAIGSSYKVISTPTTTGNQAYVINETGDGIIALSFSILDIGSTPPTAIIDDYGNSGAKATVSNYTYTINITNAGRKRKLIVMTQARDASSSDLPVTGITAGGISMTKTREDIYTAGLIESSIWYLDNPPTGAVTISVTHTGTVDFAASEAVSLQGMATGAAETSNGASHIAAVGSNPSVSVTTVADNVIVFGSSYSKSALGGPAIASGNIELYQIGVNSNGDDALSSLKKVATPGSTTLSWTNADNDDWVMTVASYAPDSTESPIISVKPNHPTVNWGNPLTQGLVFDLPLWEGSGLKANTFNIQGTLANAPTWNKKLFGQALTFADNTNIINYTSLANQNSLSQITVEALVYPTAINAANDSRIIHKGNSTKYFYVGLTNIASANRFQCGQEYNTREVSVYSNSISFNTWYHLVVTIVSATADGTGINFYMNAVPATGGIFATGTGAAPSDTTELFIGNRGSAYGSTKGFVGDIAYVRYWNRILTSTEVRALYENPWRIYKRMQLPMINSVSVTSNIKTFNGLAYASTKTINGLALASIKTFNGLA